MSSRTKNQLDKHGKAENNLYGACRFKWIFVMLNDMSDKKKNTENETTSFILALFKEKKIIHQTIMSFTTYNYI